MEREKVLPQTEDEFITGVAEDCISNLKDKDKQYLCDNPCRFDYHFSYALYIRNHYIHNRDFSDVDFFVEPDHLSGQIMERIFSLLLPDEYFYNDYFTQALFMQKGFIRLRKAYRLKYGKYPVELEMHYYNQAPKPTSKLDKLSHKEIWDLPRDFDFEADREKSKKDRDQRNVLIDELIRKLADIVWDLDEILSMADSCGISRDLLLPEINKVKEIFFDDGEYIPMVSVLIPYSDRIEPEKYGSIRDDLCCVLEEHPSLVEKLDEEYFRDPVIAKVVLKHGFAMEYLPEYQNDDEMVRYALNQDGSAIRFVNVRYLCDRAWVKLAIEHSAESTIMYYDCMEPYRKDKEFVYLACSLHRWNYVYVDETFRDDYELAKIVLAPPGDLNNVFRYLSDRLKDDLSLALLDAQCKHPDVKAYSERLRDNEEVADMLKKTHGSDDWHFYDMSDRIKQKYNYKSN